MSYASERTEEITQTQNSGTGNPIIEITSEMVAKGHIRPKMKITFFTNTLENAVAEFTTTWVALLNKMKSDGNNFEEFAQPNLIAKQNPENGSTTVSN